MSTLTITTTGAQDARIVVAFGARLGLGGNATAAQVKAEVINFIRGVVQNYEQQQNNASFNFSPLDPT